MKAKEDKGIYPLDFMFEQAEACWLIVVSSLTLIFGLPVVPWVFCPYLGFTV